MNNDNFSSDKSKKVFENTSSQHNGEQEYKGKGKLTTVLVVIVLVVLAGCFLAYWLNDNAVLKETEVEETEVITPVEEKIETESVTTELPSEIEKEVEKEQVVNSAEVKLYTDAASLEQAKGLWEMNCIPCHNEDGGGGICPNLTDDHWILGGGFDNIYNVIKNGGRPGKGMVSWKDFFTPKEIALVTSYVISLNGTAPEDPKAPEGDIIWSKEM